MEHLFALTAFIHESIKTRVETGFNHVFHGILLLHLSMNPLKQGLKHDLEQVVTDSAGAFIHESIKTRVET